MGTDPWGPVVKKVDASKDLNAVVAQACGSEVDQSIPHSLLHEHACDQHDFVDRSCQNHVDFLYLHPFDHDHILFVHLFVVFDFIFGVVDLIVFCPVYDHLYFRSCARLCRIFQAAAANDIIPTACPNSDSHNYLNPHHLPRTTPTPTPTPAAVVPPANTGSGGTSGADIQAYLAGHNTVRAQHGAAPLTWNDNLASKAQEWANGCQFKHSGGALGAFGENLAAGTGSSYSIAQAIKSWTDEVVDYNPNNPSPSHFTQVVWKGTTQVGCAVQSCSGIFEARFGPAKYFVCEYSPQGNIIGRFGLKLDTVRLERVLGEFEDLDQTDVTQPNKHGNNARNRKQALSAFMLSSRVLRTASETAYGFLILITVIAAALSCTALISQAVRTSPTRSWSKNINAVIVGAAYFFLFAVSVLFCVKRRVAVRLKLQRISKTYRTIGRDDLPGSVDKYVMEEYIRACLVSFESLPTDVHHEGWGRPGTQYSGIRFRRALLDTIPRIAETHARMLHHFRFIAPLLPKDDAGLSPLHYYDSAIQLVRNSKRELTEEEFEVGLKAAEQIMKRWDMLL
ncbi:hypothetical protein NLJ89_g7594 [Agrocybe chaxingu]|uniref:SCP domain-containing protein n=1 Tax=Agrocybe chaxingu TaxID=84603 RepID=A0A9W8K448_9AGAR|nr:hypothetical protein NLJ89_g7594 [Agrocybe chaxingu]